jgi:hypothetical protein
LGNSREAREALLRADFSDIHREVIGMRKLAGVLMAGAIALPIGLATAPAGAAPKTSCKTTNGSATFSPPQPKLGSKKKVASTIKVQAAKVGGCVGGGVVSATAALTAKYTKPGNCTTLGQGVPNPAKGKMVLTWNTMKTSTIGALTVGGVPGKPTSWKITGKISAGLFNGAKVAVTVIYAPSSGGCEKTALSRATFKQATPFAVN